MITNFEDNPGWEKTAPDFSGHGNILERRERWVRHTETVKPLRALTR